eukprot:TRINITY_DN6960_c0_g4_i4.p1 TRINITY_DN6960_c0_g4~~TRINITY_DN6960_c0_g4_i4.p1  ORF type:complete len:248 (+),score=27.92 TRINITY_DN6960_c0_g4_i4:110-853(+)
MCFLFYFFFFFFFQAEDGIRDAQESRGLGDVYKRQHLKYPKSRTHPFVCVCFISVYFMSLFILQLLYYYYYYCCWYLLLYLYIQYLNVGAIEVGQRYTFIFSEDFIFRAVRCSIAISYNYTITHTNTHTIIQEPCYYCTFDSPPTHSHLSSHIDNTLTQHYNTTLHTQHITTTQHKYITHITYHTHTHTHTPSGITLLLDPTTITAYCSCERDDDLHVKCLDGIHHTCMYTTFMQHFTPSITTITSW